ncbi:hypothetical protein VTH82DRAFT_64 [Thermothelomyces myriococcoides]
MSAEAIKTPPGPESPTTVRPLEMDDDDLQEQEALGVENATAKADANTATTTTTTAATTPSAPANAPAAAANDVPPPKPPRPLTEEQRNQQTLKEAFPTVDNAVIRAVLRASGGRIEAAFNALLEMTDPEAAEREQPPPRPPRPAADPAGPTSSGLSQLEADELYARQLAEHYENVGAYEARTANRAHQLRSRRQPDLGPYDDPDDREHSFLDDDLPLIKESLRKGFLETQSKVNNWINNFKKKLDETFEDDGDDDDYGQGSSSFMGRPTRGQARRSADYDRYDADPEVLSDDFAGMKFRSDGTPVPPPRPASANNPNLFRPPPPSKSPKPGERKVTFRDTVEDIDAYSASPRAPPKDATATAGTGGAAKSSKWQPLSPVDPNPIVENDPFSLGDSDDEREMRDKTAGSREIKMEDTERLKQATADAMADSLVEDNKNKGEGGSGTAK